MHTVAASAGARSFSTAREGRPGAGVTEPAAGLPRRSRAAWAQRLQQLGWRSRQLGLTSFTWEQVPEQLPAHLPLTCLYRAASSPRHRRATLSLGVTAVGSCKSCAQGPRRSSYPPRPPPPGGICLAFWSPRPGWRAWGRGRGRGWHLRHSRGCKQGRQQGWGASCGTARPAWGGRLELLGVPPWGSGDDGGAGVSMSAVLTSSCCCLSVRRARLSYPVSGVCG